MQQLQRPLQTLSHLFPLNENEKLTVAGWLQILKNLILLFFRSTALIADLRNRGFTEVSVLKFCLVQNAKKKLALQIHIFQFNPLNLFEIAGLLVKGVTVTLKFKNSYLGVQLVTKLPLNYVMFFVLHRGLISTIPART